MTKIRTTFIVIGGSGVPTPLTFYDKDRAFDAASKKRALEWPADIFVLEHRIIWVNGREVKKKNIKVENYEPEDQIVKENVFTKRLGKNCSYMRIHEAHEWRYTRASEGIIEQLCWCVGLKVDATETPMITTDVKEREPEIMPPTLYELIVSVPDNPHATERKLFSLAGAAAVYDNGWIHVSFGDIVYENGDTRPMTEEDQKKISDAADDYSANK